MNSVDIIGIPKPQVKKTILPVLLVTLVSLGVTGIGGYITQQAAEAKLNRFFVRQADQIANTYANKLNTQITILEGVRGLYNSSGDFTAHSFSDYLASIDLSSADKSGASSYFYLPSIKHEDEANFIKKIRNEKDTNPLYKTFTIKPESNYDFHYPVTYGYPIEGRESAFGLDFATFPERLDAIIYARDNNTLATTKTIKFETTGKPGFFFLLPLYFHDKTIERTVERREAFAGVVGVAFRSESAFEQIFGGEDPYPYLDFQIYQGDATTPDRLLHDHNPNLTIEHPRFETIRKVNIHGQSWTITVQSKSNFAMGEQEERLPVIVTISWLVMTILLLIYSLYNLNKIYRSS